MKGQNSGNPVSRYNPRRRGKPRKCDACKGRGTAPARDVFAREGLPCRVCLGRGVVR